MRVLFVLFSRKTTGLPPRSWFIDHLLPEGLSRIDGTEVIIMRGVWLVTGNIAGVSGVWARLRWSFWVVVCPWRRSNFKLETSLLVAALVKCNVSGNRKPSLKDPSFRWNAELLSTKSTCRSQHSTRGAGVEGINAFSDLRDFRLGHTSETITDRAIVFAFSMRSLVFAHDVGDGLVHATVTVVTTNSKDNMTEFAVAGELVDSRLCIFNLITADAYTLCGHQLNLANVPDYAATEKRRAVGSGEDTAATPCRSCWFSVKSVWYASSFSFRRSAVDSCCFCSLAVVWDKSCTSLVRVVTEGVRSWTWAGKCLHLKQGEIPGKNSSVCAMQSLCIHDAQWQLRISLLSWVHMLWWSAEPGPSFSSMA